MSFFKSDSLLSNIKNVSIRFDNRNNDSDNIFGSLVINNLDRNKSIRLESVGPLDGPLHSLNNPSSILKDPTPLKQNPGPTYHYNWIVCKNNGLSEQEDNEENDSQKNKKNQNQVKQMSTESKSYQIGQQRSNLQKESVHQTKPKNQTKNIPKNYGKAIICFFEKYHEKVERVTEHYGVNYYELLADLKKKKKEINTIAHLRALWSKYKYAKCMRAVSNMFFRQHALSYIFDSRICTFNTHLKYRQRLCEAVSNPEQFTHIKDY